MTEYVTIQRQIERRTYLKGMFKGKFVGYLDYVKSDIKHENFYDLEVLSGEISTSRSNFKIWREGDEFEEYIGVEKFLTKLPDSLPCEVLYPDGNIKHFQVNLNEPKLSNYTLTNQHYDGSKIYGDIVGEISGYLKHYDIEDHEIEVNDKEEPDVKLISIKVKTDKQTGKTEAKGEYKRWEYYYADKSTYWGDWTHQGRTDTGLSFWSIILGLLQFALFLLFLIPIIVAGWQIILPLLIIGGAFYLFSVLQSLLPFIWKGLIRLFSYALVFSFVFGIISLFRDPINTNVKKELSIDSADEIQTQIRDEENITDSIISHHRVWEDYNNNIYSGDIEVRVSHLKSASIFRNNLSFPVQEPSQYNYLVSRITEFDKGKLSRIYNMFDSLKMSNAMTELEFAQVITCCIQDIPYTLILDNACDSRKYNDDFIRNYLTEGGKCEGYIKFGLLSPIEFMGSLNGDCDTRTLLLFTILNHYNFDVAMLGSELYRHSVIAINLPFTGLSKTINGKQYVIWETTEKGIRPGVLPREISDMRFWNVNLISNNQSI
ncbi:MAG: hypothetical protein IPJ86_14920 [Bacteroidetes bacterium]|nr:hypothetical protein [Bacteroidota bacterium]